MIDMNNALPFTQCAAQFGTPLYIYDKQQLQSNLRRLLEEISYRPLRLHLPLIANDTASLLHLGRTTHTLGAFVNSPRHLSIALHKVGWPPHDIIYASSNISEEIIRHVARFGVIFHANSLREVHLYGRYAPDHTMGLRIAWPLPEQTQVGRLGLQQHELAAALDMTARQNLKITGLHFYLGTNITQADYYLEQLEKIIPLTRYFSDLKYLDLSGGFALESFDYGRLNIGLEQLLGNYEKQFGRRLEIIFEPGRAIFGNAGYLLTQIMEVKREPERILLGVDASYTLLPLLDLAPDQEFHQATLVAPHRPSSDRPVTIYGASTYSHDCLARDIDLAWPEVEDLIVFSNAGAYTYACLSNYLGITRPAQVLVDKNQITLITLGEEIFTAR